MLLGLNLQSTWFGCLKDPRSRSGEQGSAHSLTADMVDTLSTSVEYNSAAAITFVHEAVPDQVASVSHMHAKAV